MSRSWWVDHLKIPHSDFQKLYLNHWPKESQMWYTDEGILVHEDFHELWWFFGRRTDWFDHAVGIVNESWMNRDAMDQRRDALAWLMLKSIEQVEYNGYNFEDVWEENLFLL